MTYNDESSTRHPEIRSTITAQSQTQPQPHGDTPFPPAGTYPDHRDPSPSHPKVEVMINTAAKHILPSSEDDKENDEREEKESKDQTSTQKGGLDAGNADLEEREEEPILRGKTLEEMLTPGIPMGTGEGVRFNLPTQNQDSSHTPVMSSTTSSPPFEGKDEDDDDDDDDEYDAAALPGQGRRDRERPGFGAGREFGSVRMGASALVSALNALPWDDGEDTSGSSDDDRDDAGSHLRPSRKPGMGMGSGAASVIHERKSRPKFSRLGSSLHTIRPMSSTAVSSEDDLINVPATEPQGLYEHPDHPLHFPFKQNTIARKARRPNQGELSYQYAHHQHSLDVGSTQEPDVPPPRGPTHHVRTSSNVTTDSEGASSIGGDARTILNERISHEEALGHEEEEEEILRAAAEEGEKTSLDLGPVISAQAHEDEHKNDKSPSELNTAAALREGDSEDEMLEERIQPNESERKRIRREKLAERLQDVFGLEEKEEVLEEMKCWLLRSVMLKGYMYLTPRHICFFANMPDRENLVVKTGPLYKRASRTKLNTKFWVVLRNDVLSWYESTADPYFPKGNISLQYASSCEAVDETHFKLRTSEKNYTFTSDTEANRDEWIKAINKVMFKTQHEGESVKLIIPLEVIMEVEKSPTLEFAETIEIKVVDLEDQMSVDSYFFAAFNDNERALSSIQRLLDGRPSSDLPRVSSANTLQPVSSEPLDSSYATIRRPRRESEGSTATTGLRKIGSVLKPLLSRNNDESDSSGEHKSGGISIPFISKTHKTSQDSLETVRVGGPDAGPDGNVAAHEGMEPDGYPPRPSGQPPSYMQEKQGSWGTSWIRKPAAKIFGSSPSSLSHGRTPPADGPTTRSGRGKRPSVTEIVETITPQSDGSDDEDLAVHPEPTRAAQSASVSEDSSSESQMTKSRSDFSMMESSESGNREDLETARKFRSVFSLSDKEHLIDHFPGYLYRVLPISGRFFVSTNYLCFRSSQLLYKTKMMIPIRDLYGLKAQKAFRFGHSGLIVVIKGHEELFFEFSSARRRKACIALLEERMEIIRMEQEQAKTGEKSWDLDHSRIKSRIMEDLDESTPFDANAHHIPPSSPSSLFASTTSTFLEFKPEPMKITCLTIGSRGDVQPYIALCKGLQAEGHTTRIATHGEYKEWVEGHGIEFASVGGDPAELMQMCVDNGMFTVSFLKEGLQKFRGWLDDLLTSSWEACQGSELLIESPSAMGGVHIAEALRIPYFRAFTMPWTRTRAYPHAFAVPEHKRGGSYNYMTYTMFDQVFWRAISGQINRWRRHVMNIEATNFDKLEQHKIPFLYNFSPSVVPPPLDWTEWIHVTGYWFLENADQSKANEKKWSPPEGLIDFIDGAHEKGKKVVYIGFGSIVVSDPQEMTRCVVEAVVESGVCAILSKGWSDRGGKSKGESTGDSEGADGVEYPPEIFSIDSIDHSWLFPRIDAACHHGGAGTSGASLRAGIPTIIKPFFGDQAFWSERVESLNVGSAVRKLTSASLAEALRKATTDEKQIAKAKVVGEMIRKENGVSKAIEAIYRDLEYAKSIIKPLPSSIPEEGKGLEKLSSILHPDIPNIGVGRVRSGSRSSQQKVDTPPRPIAKEHDQNASDDGWSVVSDGGGAGAGARSRNGSNASHPSSSPETKPSRIESILPSLPSIPSLLGKKIRSKDKGDDSEDDHVPQ